VETPEESRAMLLGVLERPEDPAMRSACDIVALNAGAALYAANVCDDIAQGIALAQRTLASGAAARKLRDFSDFTQSATASTGP
jgi:anthranilate phosphoribosyltransferase